MLKKSKTISCVLCIAMILSLFSGCKVKQEAKTSESTTSATISTSETTPIPSTTEAPPDYAADYLAARAAADAEAKLQINTEIRTEMVLGEKTLVERQAEKVRYQNRGSDDLIVACKRRVIFNVGEIQLDQLYYQEKLYTTYKSNLFYAKESEENYLSQQTPLAMLDPANYAAVSLEGNKIRFSDPLAGERWALPEGAELFKAEGSATLQDGVLIEQSYSITYDFCGNEIHNTYRSEITPGLEEDLSELVPKGTGSYIKLDSTEALLLMLRSINTLIHVDQISLDTRQTILCQAADLIMDERSSTKSYGSGKDLIFSDDVKLTLYDLSGEITQEQNFQEKMVGDSYSYQYDEEEPETESVSDTDRISFGNNILNSIQSIVYDSIPDPKYLTGAAVYDIGDYYLVEYQCNETCSREVDKVLNYRLFQDTNKLMDLCERYAPGPTEGYLAVEKVTWLPTAVNLSYSGSYIFEGTATRVSLTQQISLSLYDQDTYEEIAGEALPDKEPEIKPDPVFYEVTDQNGAKLYLFGTIHVGDDRTAFLPQSIYDAFDSADALAVEFDDMAFEEEIENDAELMQRVAEAYYYTDGTVISDHIEEAEVYQAAVSLMKVMGQYDNTAEYLKPFVWQNTITSFYLNQGRKLTYAKGVDRRLMSRAREQEKEILNVESGLEQLEMLSGYSDRLQELMLAETMQSSRSEYLQETMSLYELWCEGDEAKLIELLAADDEEELSEMDEESRKLYEEYHSAMETDRNVNMVEVAREYLQSGKTVFFAVGLAHLLGDGGLVQALRDAGYTVTLIQDQS